MATTNFVIADVFTNKRFGGNQLAVFTDGSRLDSTTMQDIAREMNYSETTFVLPPESGGDYRLRIFTPARELPFAGHPLVGSAYVVVSEGLKPEMGREATVTLETGVGPISVEVKAGQAMQGEARMTQPLPVVRGTLDHPQSLAAALSLDPSDIATESPIEAIYNGITVLIVPVTSLAAVRKIKFDINGLERIAAQMGAETILAFTRETEARSSTVHCRVSAPAAGVIEDAATGSANGPLGYYLVRHRLVEVLPLTTIVSEQGYEMKRPSILNIEVETAGADVKSVRVGGGVVIAGRGKLYP